jgi:hypothetical protein
MILIVLHGGWIGLACVEISSTGFLSFHITQLMLLNRCIHHSVVPWVDLLKALIFFNSVGSPIQLVLIVQVAYIYLLNKSWNSPIEENYPWLLNDLSLLIHSPISKPLHVQVLLHLGRLLVVRMLYQMKIKRLNIGHHLGSIGSIHASTIGTSTWIMEGFEGGSIDGFTGAFFSQ